MSVEVSIREPDVGTSNHVGASNPSNSLTEEEIWSTRQERIKNALADARAAVRQEPADLYAAASRLVDVIKRANVEEFISEIERLADQTDPSATIIFQGLSRGSLLHIAVLAGKDDILRLLLDIVHDHFVATQDNWGNTPLHIATKAKAIEVVKMLTRRVKDFPFVQDKVLLRTKNNHGNTALHEAVLTGDVGLVRYLLKEDLETVYWKNVDQKSPLYLALETCNPEILQELFSLSLDPLKIEGMPPVHGAVLRNQCDILEEIFKWNGNLFANLFAMKDPKDGNVLHLAAFLNKPQVLKFLRPETEYLARQWDSNGDLPIHIASKRDHVALIKKLHPVSQSINRQGQTVLHVAAKYGASSAMSYILKHPDLGTLINERDYDGNTPLHLAAMYMQPTALIYLVLDERINPFLLNHKCSAAIDIARDHSRVGFRKAFAQLLLLSVSAKRSDLIILKPETRDKAYTNRNLPNPDELRNDVNTLFLVAVLVTTVTFTAGFAVPGGLNGSDMASKDDRGMATMLHNIMFQAFVICNTIAMLCSMSSVVSFMFMYMNIGRAGLLLSISLPTMTAAFLIGVILTVGKLPWLVTTISILGSIFVFVITDLLLFPMTLHLSYYLPLVFHSLGPLRPLLRWLLFCDLRLLQATMSKLDELKEVRTGSNTSTSPPLDGGGED